MTTRLKSTCKAGILVAACVSLAVCASCSDEEVMKDTPAQENDKMCFGVSLADKWNAVPGTRSAGDKPTVDDAGGFENGILRIASTVENGIARNPFQETGAQTRGTTVNRGNFYDSFKVYAYTYEGTDWANGSAKTYLDNETVTKSGNVWATDPLHFWPNSGQMKFLAYAPSDMQEITTDGTTHTLNYTVPDVGEQKDLLVAEADVAGDYRQTLDLEFKHILTAVKVKAHQHLYASQGAIESITFKNIKSRGTHKLGTDTWTGQNENKDFVIDMSSKGVNNGKMVLDDSDNTTLLMIPQELGADAELEVVFNEEDGRGTITGRIGGGNKEGDNKIWEMGTTVIYRLPFVFLLRYYANEGQFADNSTMYTDRVVSYDANENKFQIKEIEPTKDGYTFLGWADSPTATSADFISGKELTLSAEAPMKTIYAVWIKK